MLQDTFHNKKILGVTSITVIPLGATGTTPCLALLTIYWHHMLYMCTRFHRCWRASKQKHICIKKHARVDEPCASLGSFSQNTGTTFTWFFTDVGEHLNKTFCMRKHAETNSGSRYEAVKYW